MSEVRIELTADEAALATAAISVNTNIFWEQRPTDEPSDETREYEATSPYVQGTVLVAPVHNVQSATDLAWQIWESDYDDAVIKSLEQKLKDAGIVFPRVADPLPN